MEAADQFWPGAELSTVVLWTKLVLAFLRNTYIDFALFLGGLFYVLQRRGISSKDRTRILKHKKQRACEKGKHHN
jgi:hypothetical protein